MGQVKGIKPNINISLHTIASWPYTKSRFCIISNAIVELKLNGWIHNHNNYCSLPQQQDLRSRTKSALECIPTRNALGYIESSTKWQMICYVLEIVSQCSVCISSGLNCCSFNLILFLAWMDDFQVVEVLARVILVALSSLKQNLVN